VIALRLDKPARSSVVCPASTMRARTLAPTVRLAATSAVAMTMAMAMRMRFPRGEVRPD